jgi:pseudaminic acid biosynthesis-associated methylase
MDTRKTFATDQDSFWSGDFGTEYINRNRSAGLLASNIRFFSNALSFAKNLNTCIEFGANIGMNLKALRLLYPEMKFYGIEINETAVFELKRNIGSSNVFSGSIVDYEVSKKFDLVFTKGVLIHINPNSLPLVYQKLVNSTHKYLLINEYYSPEPVSVEYRGNPDRLFKRDFAGEIMKIYPEMKLIDYGFSYKRDPEFPQDDINWFLMQRN